MARWKCGLKVRLAINLQTQFARKVFFAIAQGRYWQHTSCFYETIRTTMKSLFIQTIIALAMLCTGNRAAAQQVTAAEYYFDTDPGAGKANPLAITAAATIDQVFQIPMAGLSNGLHFLGVRLKQTTGEWGAAEKKIFVVQTVAAGSNETITAAEYYFDTDPGSGKATALAVTAQQNIDATLLIPVAGLTQGVHPLFVRLKNNFGQWGNAEWKLVYINNSFSAEPDSIVRGEFFIGTDPGPGKGSPFLVNKGIDLDSLIKYMANNLPLGNYTIGCRLQNNKGNWGFMESKAFTVCATYGPIAAFDYVIDKDKVSFLNRSEHQTVNRWQFAPNDTSRLLNPFKTITPGDYNPILIAANGCGSDTAVGASFTIEGIKGITPAQGGNIGYASIIIEGFGFTPATTFTLTKGGKTLVFDTIVVQNSNTISSRLNLVGAETGFYQLELNIPGIGVLTKDSAFEVEVGLAANPVITITNPPVVRRGSPITIRIVVSNPSNNDIYGVPVIVDGLPGKKEGYLYPIDLPRLLSIEGLLPLPEEIDALMSIDGRFTSIIPIIPPGGTFPITPTFPRDPDFPNPTEDPPSAEVDGSVYEPKQIPSLDLSECAECGKEAITDIVVDVVKNAVDLALILKFTPYSAWRNCIGGGIDFVYGLYGRATAKPSKNTLEKIGAVYSWSNIIVGGISTGVECATAIRGTTPTGLLLNAVNQTYQLYKKRIEPAERLMTYVVNPAVCMNKCMQAASTSKSPLAILTSRDPNAKIGLGSTSNPYINRTKGLLYTIYFENDAAATLPAQTVVIKDTIDKTKFDVSTIRFSSASVANQRTDFIGDGLQAIGEIDLRPRLNFKARVNALADTAKGIITWQFQTIDPTTNQETTDPLAGFLPANLANNEGDGNVSFTINVKDGVGNGDEIANKASIVFDFNPAIITDNWVNTFDLVPPTSSMNALPDTTKADSVLVSWTGADDVSGIDYYTIYLSKNGGDYGPSIRSISTNSFIFKGEYDNTYSFVVQAVDKAGNTQALDVSKGKKTYLKLVPTQFRFIGNGNYSSKTNWLNGLMPPENLPKGSEIILSPQAGGECILDKLQYLRPNSKFTVAPGAKVQFLDKVEIK
jgi:hypothetical protein